jgi:GNAT superfamily N-acetyltransferase
MDDNLFMICRRLNHAAFSPLPPGFYVRQLHPNELSIWKALPFDDQLTAQTYLSFMDEFIHRTYAADLARFFTNTLVICEQNDQIVATCLLWRAYGLYTTVHWFKVRPAYENRGIGRALLSLVFAPVTDADMPIYLHTQSASFRAIKLYADFGFDLLTDKRIGQRDNHLEQCLPVLQAAMPAAAYEQLRFTTAPAAFIAGMALQHEDQF